VADSRGGKDWRSKDGRRWRIGSEAEVRWIEENTEGGVRITSAIPPVFEAYATLELPGSGNNEALSFDTSERHDGSVLSVLVEHTAAQPWWLGYLETGCSNVVFDDAPRVELYAGWGYVLVEAGPEQARHWRGEDWKGYLPDLMFPADRSWLFSTLWDDDWTCIGGSKEFVNAFLADPELRDRVHQVDPSIKDATPPGHVAF
jgi:hypothetical protein